MGVAAKKVNQNLPNSGFRMEVKTLRLKKEKPRERTSQGWNLGGVDGTRTRDPRRDRPVF